MVEVLGNKSDTSNQIIKICLDGNKHLKHVLTNDVINTMTMLENRFPLSKLPVCGGCEKLGLWSHGFVGICRDCGTITKNPLTYSEYLASGYDIDATGNTAREVLTEEKEVRRLILPDHTNYAQKARERSSYGV